MREDNRNLPPIIKSYEVRVGGPGHLVGLIASYAVVGGAAVHLTFG